MTQFTQRVRALALRTARHAALAGALLASAMTAMAQTETPIGMWQTIDDHTGQPKALVQITQDGNGELSGKIIKGLGANNEPDRRCTECTDARKDQPILGMTIISSMKKDGDAWDHGQILDPENGKVYKCKMHLEDGGNKLVVRGYIGVALLGRSQTWIRQQ
ncbi:putative signal peptide protein [Burkholderia sp. H160]|nr:putative signal peptide protein [Burkholderia sp. H160]